MAIEKLSFRKFPRLCELEARHGVSIGSSYTNEIAGKTFTHYVVQSQRQQVLDRIVQAKFFSLLIDGSTVDAAGLFQNLSIALRKLGCTEVDVEHCSKLVAIGSDGAATNIARGGLKGLVEAELDWVFWMWCLAHRLKLAVKDALKGTAFAAIDDMLLKLYYLYEKSPKKCRELEEVISDLKNCITFDDVWSRPVRVSGSRWVSHRLSAMRRVLSSMERIPTISSLYLRIAQSGVQTGPNFMAIAVSGQMLSTYWAVQCSLMFSLPPAFFPR